MADVNFSHPTRKVPIPYPDIPANLVDKFNNLLAVLDRTSSHLQDCADRVQGFLGQTNGTVEHVASQSEGEAKQALVQTWVLSRIDGSQAHTSMSAAATHLRAVITALNDQQPALSHGMATLETVQSTGGQVSASQADEIQGQFTNLTNTLSNIGLALDVAATLIDGMNSHWPQACATGFIPGKPHPVFQRTDFDLSASNGKVDMVGGPGGSARSRKTGGEDTSGQSDETLAEELAIKLHERWQQERNYESRIKNANDPVWTAEHDGQTELDIANTPYSDLPATWQAENRASAEAALNIVQDLRSSGKDLTQLRFVRDYLQTGKLSLLSSQGRLWDTLLKAGDSLHENWLSRNGAWAPVEQKVPFSQLSEEEQQKDLVVILEAVRLLS